VEDREVKGRGWREGMGKKWRSEERRKGKGREGKGREGEGQNGLL
jgi:hypothetical protein